jgi:hypothetical protein
MRKTVLGAAAALILAAPAYATKMGRSSVRAINQIRDRVGEHTDWIGFLERELGVSEDIINVEGGRAAERNRKVS